MAEDTKVRDSLAKERTNLANERTLLAYWRTALAFFLAGAVLIRIDRSTQSAIIAGVLIALGFGTFIFGVSEFIRYKKKIDRH